MDSNSRPIVPAQADIDAAQRARNMILDYLAGENVPEADIREAVSFFRKRAADEFDRFLTVIKNLETDPHVAQAGLDSILAALEFWKEETEQPVATHTQGIEPFPEATKALLLDMNQQRREWLDFAHSCVGAFPSQMLVLRGKKWRLAEHVSEAAHAGIRMLETAFEPGLRVGIWTCTGIQPVPALTEYPDRILLDAPVQDFGVTIRITLREEYLKDGEAVYWVCHCDLVGETSFPLSVALGTSERPATGARDLRREGGIDFRIAPPTTEPLRLFLSGATRSGELREVTIELPVVAGTAPDAGENTPA